MAIKYLSGFGNEFATEAVEGALPVGRNSPQKAPLGLYAEQFSGTAFTVPRVHNKRTWTYRIRPSVLHKPFQQRPNGMLRSTPFDEIVTTPNQLRWDPLPLPSEPTDFISGITTIAGNGDLYSQAGIGIHIYACIQDRYRYDGADVAHVILKKHEEIDWRKLLNAMELYWEVLLIHLLNFRFIYPTERERIPRWLFDELMERLQAQAEMPAARMRICRGRLFSPRDYVTDIAEWGFADVVGKGIEEKHERKK